VDVIETGTGDLARRVTHRRQELGLTQEEVARRTGMASGYPRYLESSPFVAPQGLVAGAAGTALGFQVNRVDEAMSEGWSVLVTRRARRVAAAELARLDELGLEPRPRGRRRAVIRVEPASISGRSIRRQDSVASAPGE
jgi:transcriptional regulator with XRE-family HTH domain